MVGMWVLWLILAVVAFFLIPVFLVSHNDNMKRKEAEEKWQVKKAEIDKVNLQVKEGTWKFPVGPFYAACKEANLSAVESEYAISKAKIIATDILNTAGVSWESREQYLKPHLLRKYFAEGKKLAGDTVEQTKQPRDAEPTAAEKTFISRAEEISTCYGNSKRKIMLDYLHEEYSAKIRNVQEGRKALMQLGMIYADQQQKESDWAIIGGIAEGIAGPAAGIMAATETIANNNKIREHNAAMRRASMDIMSGTANLVGNEIELEKELDQIKQQQKDIWNKVVLSSHTSADIWANIQLGKPNVKKTPSGVLAVSLPVAIKKNFKLDVPQGVVMVVDGTIKGEVWFENKLLGDIIFPLPLYGIPTNMIAEMTLDGMCGRSVKYDGKYTVKIADKQNLWIMEA